MAITHSDVELWKERIRNGQRFQQQFALSGEWGKYKDYLRHKGFAKGVLPVNIMHSTLRSMMPQIYPVNPRVCVTSRKPGLEAEFHARIVQKLDNWMIYEVGIKQELKKIITDNFACGIGGGFFGYDSLYGFSSKHAVDSQGQSTLTQFNKKGSRIEFQSNVTPGMPWFLRCRPEDYVFPWGSTSFEALEWVAFRVFRKVEDVKADEKYSNTADLTGSYVPRRRSPEGGAIIDINEAAVANEEVQWVELWQVHDARSGEILALTMDHPQLLRKETDDLQIEYLPADFCTFNQDPDYIYGVPDARLIEPQMLELNDIRTQAMRHRRINIVKALIRKGVLSDEALLKLASEQPQAFVEVRDEAVSLQDVVLPLSPGVSGILQDMVQQGEVAQSDIREMVGFSKVAMGDFQGKTHISATETNKVSQALNMRMAERRDMITDLMERVIRKFNQIIFERWTTERVAQIVGPDGAKYWLKFTGPQIKDEYDLSVVAEDGPPMDSETKKNLVLQAAEAWAKLNPGYGASGMPTPPEIQRMIFNQFTDTGIDVDKLIAQTQAAAPGAMAGQQQGGVPGGMGGSPEAAMPPGMLAQIMQAKGRR
jgi:hypothetical protein